MPDHEQLADEAAQYVMGGLNDIERARFEARLAESAELRAQVRELEEGMTALAMTAPLRQPPAKVWNRIEQAITQESGWRKAADGFQRHWWLSGWAAAAACLVGWLFYAAWMHHTRPIASSGTYTAEASSPSRVASNSSVTVVAHNSSHPATPTNFAPSPYAATQETAALRRQIAELKEQLTRMAQSNAQQQAMLTESNRIKFLQLSQASGTGQEAAMGTLSPALQRALFLAMARELGWLQNSDDPNAPGFAGASNLWNVDFVDLRPGASNAPVNVVPQKQEVQNTTVNPTTPVSVASAPAIPAFVSGNNLILAIDSNFAEKGSSLSFSTGATPDTQQYLGNVVMGDNPVVVTVPFNNAASDGLNNSSILNIYTMTPAGSAVSTTYTISPNGTISNNSNP